MKKLLLLSALLIYSLGFSQNDKKLSKKLKINIENRRLDLNATFVPIQGRVRTECPFCCDSRCVSNWKSALFKQGLDTGDSFNETKLKDSEIGADFINSDDIILDYESWASINSKQI